MPQFLAKDLEDLLDLDYSSGLKVKEREFIEHCRWRLTFRLVFEDKGGTYFAVYYNIPSTELQECETFPTLNEETGFVEVEIVYPVERSVIVYVGDQE